MPNDHEKRARKAVNQAVSVWAPPRDLTCSAWADEHRRLSLEASAEPGVWNTDTAPFQRGIMDALNDPLVERMTFMASSQVGKTEIALNLLGYYMHQDPAPAMVVQPTLEMAEAFSKGRLAPMIRDTPALAELVHDARSRDSGNTLLHKTFPGGHVTITGANSPAGLASRPIRILLADEIDRYPASAGTEGNPLALAEKRTRTFWNRKIVRISSPTVEGISEIAKLYAKGSQEHFHLPCPSCGEYQPLRWRNLVFDTIEHACEHCGTLADQYAWQAGMLNGRWVAEAVNRKHRSFHIFEMYSPWSTWAEMVEGFLEAKREPDKLKVFINTSLAETYEERGEGIDGDALHSRLREPYDAEVPDGVLLLSMAVDLQADRMELEVCGWGMDEESWQVDYRIIPGSPTRKKTWEMLDDVLNNTYTDQHGNVFGITITMVDSGNWTSHVYDWVSKHQRRRVYAIKGVAGEGRPYVAAPSRKKRAKGRGKVPVYPLGVDELKTLVYDRLEIDEPGPGYCHFPEDAPLSRFKGMTAEVVKVKKIKGWDHRVWVKTRPYNEPLDLRAYNTAAIKLLNPIWSSLAKKFERNKVAEQAAEEPAPATTTQKLAAARKQSRAPRRKGNYANRWKR